MYNRDYRDLGGGGALVLVGAFATVHAVQTLNLGTINSMGPGMFPAAIGVILAILGVLIMIPALFRQSAKLDADMRSFVTIIGSILAFGSIVRPFGIVPAIVAMTLVASRAHVKLTWVATAVVAACLSVGAVLIFVVALGLPFSAFNWPW